MKNNKPTAVVISVEEFEEMNKKIERLEAFVEKIKEEYIQSSTVSVRIFTIRAPFCSLWKFYATIQLPLTNREKAFIDVQERRRR